MADNYSINDSRLMAVHALSVSPLGALDLALGLADGNAISITQTDPSRDAVQGADGRSVAFDTNKSMFELTINYFATAEAIRKLLILHGINTVKATSGDGDFALTYIQGSTGRKYVSPKAFVMQVPDNGDDNSAVPEVEFTIKMLDVVVV